MSVGLADDFDRQLDRVIPAGLLPRRLKESRQRGYRFARDGAFRSGLSVDRRGSWSTGQMEGVPAESISAAMVWANASGRERNG